MDKKLLEALDNLSFSLELIANALKSKETSNSSTTNALKSGDFSKQLTEITTSLKSIKSDTGQILKNQSTIIELSKKENRKDNIFGDAGAEANKDSVKKGVTSIILIAGAVLAIGLAFKLIGRVDFVSVLALSLSIVLISDAFLRVSEKKIGTSQALQTAIVMIIMSGAIMLSSWVLALTRPIGFGQAVTAILIAGMFSVISFGIKRLIDAMGGNDIISLTKSIIYLPLIMPAIALGIALSSWALSLVKPIGFSQAITAIMIAGVFTVISFGIARMARSLDDIKNPMKLLMIPFIMPLLAGAIALSSIALSEVRAVTFQQFITSLGISILFIALAFGIGLMSPVLDKINWKHVIMLPLLFTTMSLAIAASSKILADSTEISFGKSMSILVFGAVMAVLTFIMGTAMIVLGKAPIKDILAGGLAVVLIAGVIMVSSQILALGDYTKYPSLQWALGTGLSIVAFGASALAIGLLVSSGIGAVALLAGAVSILGIAATIVAVSHILKAGDYAKYPDIKWAAGVGLSMASFGLSMIGIGGLIVGSLGLGMLAMESGKDAVLMIAQTIVDASFILKKGDYKGGPTLAWSGGIALALAAFSPIYAMLVANKMMSLFGGGIGPKDFKNAILTVSDGIVTAANFFKGKGDIFKGGPNKEWSSGVGLAIGAFSPVYGMLAANKIMSLFGGGVGPEDFSKAIIMVAGGIVVAANFFKGKGDIFKGGPTEAWARGVGGAIGAFTPVFKIIADSKGIFSSGTNAEEMTSTMLGITNAIVKVAIKLHTASRFFSTKIDPDFIKSLTVNTLGFVALANKINEMKGTGSNIASALGLDSISQTASGMIKLAGAYDKLASSLRRFSNSLKSIDDDKVSSIRKLTGNLAILAAMNKSNFESMMNTLEEKGSVFSKLIDANNDSPRPAVGDKKNNLKAADKAKVKGSKYGSTAEQLDLVIDILTRIDSSTTSVDEYIASKGIRPTSLNETN